ncbi:hypothetical protein ACSL103130_11225 [Actinomyces slackii]|uniref:Uncharacterized protein n=1 Tax=Actinomyces slackii TaxID=52774 RepID=A0A3S4STB4_9ACTO|nr:hypothetical protein [Actinomyces slackii]VEG74577.1 Uncharacterised protein [Actinomyces slackii]
MIKLLCTLQILAGNVCERVTARLGGERGASTVEWVIITGFLIVVAAVVGRAVIRLVTDASSNLQIPRPT